MKGHPHSNGVVGGSGGGSTCGGGCGWMKKKKMAMLAVVIVVAVMGVMVVQKVRDRRLFNLVIKDKDRQIISLHLLLQKERQYAKESKRKNQDLNAKLYSLRTQKSELDNKIMEMQSTIGSIKDERRALEIAIEEKQNEIKQKESQIKDLKTVHQIPPKIWSVSSDDPSNHAVNLTDKLTTTKRSLWLEHQESVDTGKLASSNETEVRQVAEENGNGLWFKGRRSFIEANESETNGKPDKRQLKEKRAEGVPEVARLKSVSYSTEAFPRAADRKNEDEAERETETKTNSSTESSNGFEADQDYKEQTED